MTNYATRIRWNMGQMPDKYFDLAYLRRIVAHADSCIATEIHNAQSHCLDKTVYPADHWRHDLAFESMVEREFDIHQLELLLSEIELAFEWNYFNFQRSQEVKP